MATRKSSSGGSESPAPTAPLQEAFAQTLQSASERLQSLNLTGTAAQLLDNGRKDIETLVEINKRSFQTLQSVVQRQTETLRQSITEWQGTVSSGQGQDLPATLAALDAKGKAAFQQALDDIRELAEVAAKSQSEAFDVVRQRIQDNVEQASQLLQGGGKKK